MTNLKVGEFVKIGVKLIGQVRYVTPDGWWGVAIVNEKDRVDEWPLAMLEPVSIEEAARIAVGG